MELNQDFREFFALLNRNEVRKKVPAGSSALGPEFRPVPWVGGPAGETGGSVPLPWQNGVDRPS
jgi:hypothetical protein